MVVGFASTASAQSDNMMSKVEEKVEKWNTEVSSSDISLALTAEQRTEITALELERLKGLRSVRKSDGDKQDKQEINKPINKKINKEILTKKQRKARKTYKDAMKKG